MYYFITQFKTCAVATGFVMGVLLWGGASLQGCVANPTPHPGNSDAEAPGEAAVKDTVGADNQQPPVGPADDLGFQPDAGLGDADLSPADVLDPSADVAADASVDTEPDPDAVPPPDVTADLPPDTGDAVKDAGEDASQDDASAFDAASDATEDHAAEDTP